jgi:Tol biopolymer transport system component
VFRLRPGGAGRDNLGEMINGRGSEVDPFIAADGTFLIFASDRPGGTGRQDLYVSRSKDGQWGPPRSLGPLVNSEASEVCPCVSPDGRYFIYTSDRNKGEPAIFRIDLGLLRLGE